MIVEKCYCCYKTDDLQCFEISVKENYTEVTGFDITDEDNLKICIKCLISLKNSLEFLRLCKDSRAKLLSQSNIELSEISEEHIIFEDSHDLDDESTEDDKEKQKKYSCNICGMKFRQRNALKCHERVHTKEKPFVCSYCNQAFTQNTTLKTHISAKHTGKSVACTVEGCDKKFSRNSFLKQHIKRDHENIREYACSHCEKKYKQKSHLSRHLDTHNHVRYQCNICEKSFSKSWSLKIHWLTHSEVKPYKCAFSCTNSTFYRRDKWLKHMSKAHPNEKVDLHPIEIPNILLNKNDTS